MGLQLENNHKKRNPDVNMDLEERDCKRPKSTPFFPKSPFGAQGSTQLIAILSFDSLYLLYLWLIP